MYTHAQRERERETHTHIQRDLVEGGEEPVGLARVPHLIQHAIVS